MTTPLDAAQRWHNTDHPNLPPMPGIPLRPICWCCCNRCDPQAADRPNPYWKAARDVLLMGAISTATDAIERAIAAQALNVALYSDVRADDEEDQA